MKKKIKLKQIILSHINLSTIHAKLEQSTETTLKKKLKKEKFLTQMSKSMLKLLDLLLALAMDQWKRS